MNKKILFSLALFSAVQSAEARFSFPHWCGVQKNQVTSVDRASLDRLDYEASSFQYTASYEKNTISLLESQEKTETTTSLDPKKIGSMNEEQFKKMCRESIFKNTEGLAGCIIDDYCISAENQITEESKITELP